MPAHAMHHRRCTVRLMLLSPLSRVLYSPAAPSGLTTGNPLCTFRANGATPTATLANAPPSSRNGGLASMTLS
jgi:hypothetical protein